MPLNWQAVTGNFADVLDDSVSCSLKCEWLPQRASGLIEMSGRSMKRPPRAAVWAGFAFLFMSNGSFASEASLRDAPQEPSEAQSGSRLPFKNLWRFYIGENNDFCQAIFKELAQYQPKTLGTCAASLVLGLPEISELQGWTELNPREHGDLYKKTIQYDAVGVAAYFGKDPEYFAIKKKSDEELQKAYDRFIASGGRMRIKRMRLFDRPAGIPANAYTQPKTLLEFRRLARQSNCPGGPTAHDSATFHYVLPDLSDLDPEIQAYEAAKSGRLIRPIQYKGQTLLMAGNSSLSFYRRGRLGEMELFCEIQRRQWP